MIGVPVSSKITGAWKQSRLFNVQFDNLAVGRKAAAQWSPVDLLMPLGPPGALEEADAPLDERKK